MSGLLPPPQNLDREYLRPDTIDQLWTLPKQFTMVVSILISFSRLILPAHYEMRNDLNIPAINYLSSLIATQTKCQLVLHGLISIPSQQTFARLDWVLINRRCAEAASFLKPIELFPE